MKRRYSLFLRLPGIFLLLMAVSCSQLELPEVPEFTALGLADSPDVVRRQVRSVYEKWQEDPLDAERNGALGMHLSVYRKYSAAETLYRRARALAPDEYRWAHYLAYTLLEQGRLEEAAEMFREALKIEPGYIQARIRLAQLLWQISDIEGSRELYESITMKYPDRVEGWLGLGKVYNHMGDNDAAVAALIRARKLGPQYGEVRYVLAQALRESGDRDAAARELAAYRLRADNKIVVPDRLLRNIMALHVGDDRHMKIGGALFAQGDYQRAAESWRAALAINPALPDAWNGLVSAHVLLGELDAAGDIYREALAAGVDYARLHQNYGVAMLNAGQLDAARDALGKAIELDPHYADAYSALGRLEIQSGAYAAAAGQFRRALASRPNDPRIRLSLARALNGAGNFDEAVVHLNLLTSDPGLIRSLVLKELALAYHGMGQKDEAIDALQRSREVARRLNDTSMVENIDRQLAKWQKQAAE